MKQTGRSYEIVLRPADLGGGWKLTLFKDGEEAGGGVFPILKEIPQAGMDWWDSLPIEERSYWLVKAVSKAASATPVTARHAYLLSVAYDAAVDSGEEWAISHRQRPTEFL